MNSDFNSNTSISRKRCAGRQMAASCLWWQDSEVGKTTLHSFTLRTRYSGIYVCICTVWLAALSDLCFCSSHVAIQNILQILQRTTATYERSSICSEWYRSNWITSKLHHKLHQVITIFSQWHATSCPLHHLWRKHFPDSCSLQHFWPEWYYDQSGSENAVIWPTKLCQRTAALRDINTKESVVDLFKHRQGFISD